MAGETDIVASEVPFPPLFSPRPPALRVGLNPGKTGRSWKAGTNRGEIKRNM